VAFGKLIQAGVNSAVPAALIVGIGILMLGIKPRWASAVMYAVIGWSFLLELIGPIINLNHWLLDTSLLHHVALSPAADPEVVHRGRNRRDRRGRLRDRSDSLQTGGTWQGSSLSGSFLPHRQERRRIDRRKQCGR